MATKGGDWRASSRSTVKGAPLDNRQRLAAGCHIEYRFDLTTVLVLEFAKERKTASSTC
ncbi:hypothetical protein BCh11DRAFT_01230 [Burkholderia sp. Ch1-1]|nr:hypothetical protein BCh11DRAFT_01230 [Burkholderia sp. Ch1-1]